MWLSVEETLGIEGIYSAKGKWFKLLVHTDVTKQQSNIRYEKIIITDAKKGDEGI